MRRTAFGTMIVSLLWSLTLHAQQNRSLTCFSAVYPPYVIENGGLTGIDVDVVREVGKRLGIDITIRLEPWKRLEEALAAGLRDCVFSYFKTEPRKAYALYTSVPLHITPYTLFVRTDKKPVTGKLQDLFGKTIGVNRGFQTTPEFESAKRLGQIKVIEVGKDEQSMRMLALGRVNAVLTNDDVGRYMIRKLGLEDIEPLMPPMSITPAYLVLRKTPDLEPLLDQFNWALFEILKDGTYESIRSRHIDQAEPD
ncbi:substrate-binding periplasmic protein [Marinobacter sp. 1Y8]